MNGTPGGMLVGAPLLPGHAAPLNATEPGRVVGLPAPGRTWLGLPRLDGYMVAHAIHERFSLAGRRPRILALTGYGSGEDRAATQRAGFDGHLTKPVDPRRLLDMVADNAAAHSTQRVRD